MNDDLKYADADYWNTYWQGAGNAGAYTDGGVSHPAVGSWWVHFFGECLSDKRPLRMLDIATGNGAVVDVAVATLQPVLQSMTCVDIAPAAIDSIVSRYPQIEGIVADARNIPLQDGEFDLVVSQYGVEYAGAEAIPEAARLVADGGRLALLIHAEDSMIYAECKRNHDAVQQVIDADFVPLAEQFFDAGFAAVAGADRQAYEAAGKRLAPAIAATEAVMQAYGEDIAGGTVARLYADVGRIHSGLPKFSADEVMPWIRSMQEELSAYRGRMASMLSAALDKEALQTSADRIGDLGLVVEVADAMYPEAGSDSLGWILTARK